MMRITAGIGTIDDYIAYVEAGADEVFAGYVPQRWMQKEGLYHCLNRREVLYVNVQIGEKNELEILSEMVKVYRKPVAITLNSLTYPDDQYEEILDIIRECMGLGFSSFIIADPTLLLYLQKLSGEEREKLTIHISGETGEVNSAMIQQMKELSADRIIFHRKNSIQEMKRMIRQDSSLEYEAFILNEKCQFHGGFCNSLHCDELLPACRLPYLLQNGESRRELCAKEENEGYLTGQSGCGLCALWKLQEAGVTYLKVVGRGNYQEDMVKDIKALKRALIILEKSKSEEEYITEMKKQLFPEGCSGNCYYR